MMGKIKILAIVLVALTSFVGYSYLFSIVFDVNTADAVSVITTGTVNIPEESADSSEASQKEAQDISATESAADSLDRQLTVINAAKADLESLRDEVKKLIDTKNKQDEEKLNGLAKIYDSMDPVQLAGIMNSIDDTLIVKIIPRMKSQKVSKIMESLPPERAAVISTMLMSTK